MRRVGLWRWYLAALEALLLSRDGEGRQVSALRLRLARAVLGTGRYVRVWSPQIRAFERRSADSLMRICNQAADSPGSADI